MIPLVPLLWDAVRNLFRRPATILYPKEKVLAAPAYRGKIEVEWERCIHCASCARVCPSGACTFNPQTRRPIFDLRQCMFCAECRDICPVKCIHLTQNFEMASGDKKELVVRHR